MVSPEHVQAEIHGALFSKWMNYIPRDNSLIQQGTSFVKGPGSVSVRGGNQWVEASSGCLKIKGLKLLAVVCSSPKKGNKQKPWSFYQMMKTGELVIRDADQRSMKSHHEG